VNALGDAIRETRGVESPTQFAARLGVDQSTLYRWETGASVPRGVHHIRALAQAGLDVSLIHDARQATATAVAR
jgi:DNA-binding transcriptional regulator YiaG